MPGPRWRRVAVAAAALAASLAVPAMPAAADLAPDEWVRQFGTDDYEDGNAVAADETGVYVVGRTDWTLPGQTRPVLGYSHAFVRKYDPSGTEAWTRQFGAEWPRNLAVAGVLLMLLGWLLGRVSRKCPRCGRPASGSSVFCSFHRSELDRMGRDAAERYRREHRSY